MPIGGRLREAAQLVVAGDRREHRAEAEEVLVRAVEALHRLVGGDDRRVDLRPARRSSRSQRSTTRGVWLVRKMSHQAMSLRAIAMPSFGVQVERDVELAGVVVVEVAADVVAGLARRERPDAAQAVEVRLRLDAHDGRAEDGEVLGADRPGAEPREVGDLDSRRAAAGVGSSRSVIVRIRPLALRSRPRACSLSRSSSARQAKLADPAPSALCSPGSGGRRRSVHGVCRKAVRRAGVAHRRAEFVVRDVLVPVAVRRAAGSSPGPPASRRCRSSAGAAAPSSYSVHLLMLLQKRANTSWMCPSTFEALVQLLRLGHERR